MMMPLFCTGSPSPLLSSLRFFVFGHGTAGGRADEEAALLFFSLNRLCLGLLAGCCNCSRNLQSKTDVSEKSMFGDDFFFFPRSMAKMSPSKG